MSEKDEHRRTIGEAMRMMAAGVILQDLYDSEINAEISWFWDAGFDVKLGDGMNGYDAEGCCDTWLEAVEQLRDWALEHYPGSQFAKLHQERDR